MDKINAELKEANIPTQLIIKVNVGAKAKNYGGFQKVFAEEEVAL